LRHEKFGTAKIRITGENFPPIGIFSWYARCWVSGMPKTKAFNPALLVSGAKNVNRLLVLLLALAATLVLGQESALTLAMARSDQIPARKPATGGNRPEANLVNVVASAPALGHQAAAMEFAGQNAADVQFDPRLEKQDVSNQRDWLQFVHRKLYADGRTGKWVNVAAGFGRIDEVEAGIWKNSGELEHPGCAYLRACFSF
jgi:hypothetical protein